MTGFVDVFGDDTIPSSDTGYSGVSLTADKQMYWPQNYTGLDFMADLMDVESDGSWSMLVPNAQEVSNGKSFVINNIGANTLTIKSFSGVELATIPPGTVKYFYLTSNSTPGGNWRVFTLGAGSSASDAATLAGFGIKAVSGRLSQNYPPKISTSTQSVAYTDLATTYVFNGSGAVSLNLLQASVAGEGFFIQVSNLGTGSVNVDPFSAELIDGAPSKALAPGESATLICTGTSWVTVGYGRSTEFQFTKLVLDVTSGSPFTLTSTQAQNKLIQFIGTASGAVTVNVPSVVAVYYTQCSYSGNFPLVLKTSSGAGISLENTDRAIVYCDGVDVVLAQTSAVPATTLAGGVAGSIVYQSAPNTTGFSAAGAAGQVVVSGGTGAPTFSDLGNITNGYTSKATPVDADSLPVYDSAAPSVPKKTTWANFKSAIKSYYDSVASTLSNKSISLSTNTVTGTGAQFDTACSDQNFLFESDVGTSVQPYDAATAKWNSEQTWSQVQRTNESVGTSLTLDLDSGYLDFRCTPAAGGALTFSNIPATPLVQKGTIRLINGSNYAITAHTNTKIATSDLTKISATGTYLLSYRTSNGIVYVVSSGSLS